jgi:hypothetical protein
LRQRDEPAAGSSMGPQQLSGTSLPPDAGCVLAGAGGAVWVGGERGGIRIGAESDARGSWTMLRDAEEQEPHSPGTKQQARSDPSIRILKFMLESGAGLRAVCI